MLRSKRSDRAVPCAGVESRVLPSEKQWRPGRASSDVERTPALDCIADPFTPGNWRWLIERLFAWLVRCQRLVNRWETSAKNFLASFVAKAAPVWSVGLVGARTAGRRGFRRARPDADHRDLDGGRHRPQPPQARRRRRTVGIHRL